MLSEYIISLADVSFHIVAYIYARFRNSGKNPMRFAVFWRISVRFCGFRTPLTPPSKQVQPLLISWKESVFVINLTLNFDRSSTLSKIKVYLILIRQSCLFSWTIFSSFHRVVPNVIIKFDDMLYYASKENFTVNAYVTYLKLLPVVALAEWSFGYSCTGQTMLYPSIYFRCTSCRHLFQLGVFYEA